MDDPTSLPLFAALFMSAAMYPLGLAWSSSGCCAECIRAWCFLDPRGYNDANPPELWHSANDCQRCLHGGKPLHPVSAFFYRCRKRCDAEAEDVWAGSVYYYGAGNLQTRCSDFLEGREPDWEGVIGCVAGSGVTQLTLQMTCDFEIDEPPFETGDPWWPAKRDSYQQLADALSQPIVFDLDCDGNGGCVQIGSPIVITEFSNPMGGYYGPNRVEKKWQAVPVATTRVFMANENGVDASWLKFDISILYRPFYEKQYWGIGEPERIVLDREPIDPPEQNVLPQYGGLGCEHDYQNWSWLGGISYFNPSHEVNAFVTHQFSITAPYGSGAAFRAMTPVGTPFIGTGGWNGDAGPLGGIERISGGSRYARVGRREPTLTASTISGISLSLSVEQAEGAETLPVWKVSKIKAEQVGPISPAIAMFTGNPINEEIAFVYEDGTQFDRGAPFPPYIRVPTAAVTFKRVAPTIKMEVDDGGLGTGAVIEPVIEQHPLQQYGPAWRVASVSVLSPGEGYADQYARVVVLPNDGVQAIYPASFVAKVGENGGVDQVVPAGVYETDKFANGGAYYAFGIDGVSITDGGAFYIEDKKLQPLVAEVTVTAHPYQTGIYPGRDGTGFDAKGVVDSKYESPTFGEVMSLDITSAGQDYMAWSREPNLENISTDGCAFEPADCSGRDLGVDSFGDQIEANANLPGPIKIPNSNPPWWNPTLNGPATFSATLQ